MGDAAYAASLADGVTKVSDQKKEIPQEKVALRRGKWTVEEEQFALRLIEEFRAGLLPLTDGTTLRTFLSKLLNCDPMRISKKFVGDNCIGKQVFRHASGEMNGFISADRMEKSKRELAELERKFLDRLLSSSTTPSASPRHDSSAGERKAKKAKVSVKAEDVHSKVGHEYGSEGRGDDGRYDSMYSQQQSLQHNLHQGMSGPYQHPHQQHPFMPPHSHDPQSFQGGLGSGLDSRGISPPNSYPPMAPSTSTSSLYGGHENHAATTQYMNQHLGYPYGPVRSGSDSSSGGGYEDWRQQQQLRHGPFDAQLNWHNQYLPSQQFFDQHQSQMRSMGGSGSNIDQSEEGLLKAKGSFYKSLKSSSTSSLDLLGTLATSISRENLVSYGTSGDSSAALSTMGSGADNTPASLNSSGISRTDQGNNLKRNSKSIQDFWMLVEMGDLSRPENEDMDINHENDVDSAVFDMEDEKSNSAFSSSSGVRDTPVAGSTSLPVSRCESAPALSGSTLNALSTGNTSNGDSATTDTTPSTSTGSTYNSINEKAPGSTSSQPEQKQTDEPKHDAVIAQSLLSMASAEHLRMDGLKAQSSTSSPLPPNTD
eukprot:CAMPEP_0114425580 /NCGR_PEP_ID=MMETSP0103-20121206/7314_1 /TAXON_ID=37642 ORGANISM="Paraphysomonas imperforata, Strain PA2" /NCGR_SAMPLE_ID=MMETSP0103 /ASSEMBLY_ACC=CAM_ASM_000201 /LENGTH=595 /DNA_ID=CAMNT_0001594431 /DNA_START=129 /DNA_END=1916 /DNA_ORIENTATION=+